MSGVNCALVGSHMAAAGGGPTIDLTNITLDDVEPSSTASCAFTMGTTGGITYNDANNNSLTPSTWGTGGPAGADYDIKLQVNSGNSPTGASVNTWIRLDVTRTWTLTKPTVGVASNSCTLSISLTGDNANVIDTCTVTMRAERES